ncbi:MAG TPA: bifunctional GNAT family N-acetyltransferase/carbon-nitrogen hydrolase family protein [Chitinophagaceae bacterium]|nr:bifunctional GNAT family N-acetyltransferase/carbon-nitrogen hydrolase family protein [Chitinophagaceae bacterium]
MSLNINELSTEQLSVDDYQQLLSVMKASYPGWTGNYWSLTAINNLIQKFPAGQIVMKANGKVIGCALSIIVNYDRFDDNHTYKQITGDYTFTTHDPGGDVLYGIEVFIHPEFRGLRMGRRLYDARKALCEQLNLKAIIFGGRIPNYHNYAQELSPKEYIFKVKTKEIYDPVLSFQLSNDFHVKKVLKGYMPDDTESKEYATLLQWDNIYYSAPANRSFTPTSYIRLGLIQWQMRPYKDLEELFLQVEYFVDAVSGYKSDFALFPELFNGPLLAQYNHLGEADAMRAIARFTPEIRDRFLYLAIKYNVNIITGSLPSMEENMLKNVGYLCHRNGKLDKYEKIHITPDEASYWGMQGGSILKAYDTDAGKVAVLICYDVEFPELARLLSEQGVQVLFVPFLTDTQNSYMRVRCCAQARAIENECYVAISGSVGNLPKVENMDIQYSQAVVFTPCDYAFPFNGIKSEATPNSEMVLISDVDLSLLDELHSYGSVRNLKDRRTDVYSLNYLGGFRVSTSPPDSPT